MKELGISIYPDQSDFQTDKAYLDLAKKYGYQRVFTSLLQLVGKNGEDILGLFKQDINYANQLGFKTVVDINPVLFKELHISYRDLSFFNQLGVWGLRLDEGFTGKEEAFMTHNPYHLKIEINMSHGGNYLDSIMAYDPDINNLIGCHNFYPQKYTGLGEETFNDYSKKYRHYGLHTAAFISAPSAQLGPWPVHEGLPTLESDRVRDVFSQVMHLRLSKMIDDILIGNAYASEAELKTIATAFNNPYPALEVDLRSNISDLEKQITLSKPHLYRGDASDYLLRDTQTRTEQSLSANNNQGMLKRGDLVIVNDGYLRYKGEFQIVLQSFKNDGRRNVVGHLTADNLALLDLIKPWSTFVLRSHQ